MPVAKLHYNPVRAPSGRLVHAITFGRNAEEHEASAATACGRQTTEGWRMALSDRLTCRRCISMVFYPVRRNAR